MYWHTSAHCWDADPAINGKYGSYQRTAADIDVSPPKPPEPVIKMLKVRPVAGRFLPWEDRIAGAEFRKSLIGE